ncbi:hypothetical protein ISP12_17095 [Acinetobacter baumannii]|nr:hypothetical protein [Acinetobacter baumannii]
MGSCAAPSAKGDDKFITTDYLQQCQYSQGTESYQQFAVRIAAMLQDAEKFKELLPLLRKLGFQ